MLPGELKPVLTALVLPPAGPLLLLLVGLLWAGRRRAAGLALAFVALASLWFLSCNAVGLALARNLLPPVQAAQPAQVQQTQAIVVLGGGVVPEAAEYGAAQPGPHTLQRLRYAAWLARRTATPVGFAGGVGWAAAGTGAPSEAAVAARVMEQEYGLPLQWVDARSRDTAENASRMAAMLLPGIRRIALVTDATHMPRAVAHFEAVGFEVLPAPTDFPAAGSGALLEWLPSGHGLDLSRQVLREWLAHRVAQVRAASP